MATRRRFPHRSIFQQNPLTHFPERSNRPIRQRSEPQPNFIDVDQLYPPQPPAPNQPHAPNFVDMGRIMDTSESEVKQPMSAPVPPPKPRREHVKDQHKYEHVYKRGENRRLPYRREGIQNTIASPPPRAPTEDELKSQENAKTILGKDHAYTPLNVNKYIKNAWKVLRAKDLNRIEKDRAIQHIRDHLRELRFHRPKLNETTEARLDDLWKSVVAANNIGSTAKPHEIAEYNAEHAKTIVAPKNYSYDYQPEEEPAPNHQHVKVGPSIPTDHPTSRVHNYYYPSAAPPPPEPPINVDINVNSAHPSAPPPPAPPIGFSPRPDTHQRNSYSSNMGFVNPYAQQAPSLGNHYISTKLVKVKPRRAKRIPKQRIRDPALAKRVRF